MLSRRGGILGHGDIRTWGQGEMGTGGQTIPSPCPYVPIPLFPCPSVPMSLCPYVPMSLHCLSLQQLFVGRFVPRYHAIC